MLHSSCVKMFLLIFLHSYGTCMWQISPIQSLIGQTGKRWVMGVISQLEDGHFYLEDLTASVEINLSDAISFTLNWFFFSIYGILGCLYFQKYVHIWELLQFFELALLRQCCFYLIWPNLVHELVFFGYQEFATPWIHLIWLTHLDYKDSHFSEFDEPNLLLKLVFMLLIRCIYCWTIKLKSTGLSSLFISDSLTYINYL